MKIIESISVSEDATLFSLSDSPADISFIAGIFEKIAEAGIDVDRSSMRFIARSMMMGRDCPSTCTFRYSDMPSM